MIRGIPSSDEFLFYPVLFPILVLWVLSILRMWSLNPTAVTSASEQSRKAAVTWLEHALVPALTSDGWAMRWCCSALLLQLSAGNWRLRTAWGEVCCGKLQRLMNSKVLKEMNTLWEINTFTLFGRGDQICFQLFTVIKDDNYVFHGFLDAYSYCLLFFLYIHVSKFQLEFQIRAHPLKMA